MPRNNSISGERWTICGRCGFYFPESQLKPQDGMLVDEKCFDDKENERRQIVISRALEQDQEQVRSKELEPRDDGEELRF